MERDKLPYINKILAENLSTEKKSLMLFESLSDSPNELTSRFTKGNIPSCNDRIKQLIGAIEHLKTFNK